MKNIGNSNKPLLRTIKSVCECDVSSRTGRNLQEIMRLIKKTSVLQIVPTDADAIRYFPTDPEDVWRIELIQIFLEEQELCDLNQEAGEWLEILCTG